MAKTPLIGSSGAIDVPMMRLMNTNIKGDFLTLSAQCGVGVDLEFAGDFNIFVP